MQTALEKEMDKVADLQAKKARMTATAEALLLLLFAGLLRHLRWLVRRQQRSEEGAAARLYCAGCGTRVANKPGAEGFTELLAMFPPLCDSTDWFQPSMHLFYEESGIEVSDKLPKYLDMPEAFGGSGKTL